MCSTELPPSLPTGMESSSHKQKKVNAVLLTNQILLWYNCIVRDSVGCPQAPSFYVFQIPQSLPKLWTVIYDWWSGFQKSNSTSTKEVRSKSSHYAGESVGFSNLHVPQCFLNSFPLLHGAKHLWAIVNQARWIDLSVGNHWNDNAWNEKIVAWNMVMSLPGEDQLCLTT